MKSKKPSALEMQVLSVLWEQGPSTVREVLNGMSDDKERAYTTILTVLQQLEKKGHVAHDTQGRSNVYRALEERGTTVAPMLKKLINTVFAGKPSMVVQNLLDDDMVNKEELDAIQELLNEYRSKGDA